MIFGPISAQLKDGRCAVIRSAEPEDADELIEYLKITALETPFLMRDTEEINITFESDRSWSAAETLI